MEVVILQSCFGRVSRQIVDGWTALHSERLLLSHIMVRQPELSQRRDPVDGNDKMLQGHRERSNEVKKEVGRPNC